MTQAREFTTFSEYVKAGDTFTISGTIATYFVSDELHDWLEERQALDTALLAPTAETAIGRFMNWRRDRDSNPGDTTV